MCVAHFVSTWFRLGESAEGRMPLLRAVEYNVILELAGGALRCASPDFPGLMVTGHLRDLFQAEFAGAGTVDLRGTASRTWADAPKPIRVETGGFHSYAAAHPITLAYQRTGEAAPLRLSDVVSARAAPPSYGESGMSRVLTIPLAINATQICTIALLRGGPDFTARDLELATRLRPILSGIYDLAGRLDRVPPNPRGTCAGVRITDRELAVLNLTADGLKATAIGRRLGISPRTVSKHIENIYVKLGTHDRVTAIKRAQDLGLLG
jgi:DNA-binding CsgD family transcriptional regulator